MFIPERVPATIVETIIANKTLTRFKHKIHNNIIETTAGLNKSSILL